MAKVKTKNPEKLNEDELVKLVDEKLEEGKNPGLEQQWYLNLAYYTGKQWISWDPNQKKLYEPPKEWWEVRLVANRIMPAIRTELAKVTKSKPVIEVVPATNEEEDIQTAKAATKLIDYLWRKINMRDKVFKLSMWFLTCGTGYLKTYWNPDIGDVIDEEGTKLGDVAIDVVSPFDMVFDKTAQEWSQVRWCIETKLRNTSYVKERYGVDVEPEDNLVSTNVFEGMLANLNGFQNDSPMTKVKDGVRVKEYWEIPSSDYPKGRHITTAGGKLLQYEDNPYGRLPYFCFTHISVPGKVHGRSVIEDMIPLNREYNKTRSQRIENKDKTINPRILVPSNCLLSEPTDAPGELLEYQSSVGKPEWIYPPSEPSYMQAELEMLIQDMNDVSGIHEVSQGQNPPGVKSGVAIAYLQEQDDTKLGPTIHTIENNLEKWATFVLELVEQYYDEPRLIKVVGKNNQIEVIEFKGADIKGNRDVIVVAGSALPQSKAARQEFILNLVDRKILTDPQVILKLLEFGSIEEVYEEVSIDINQAKSENKRFLAGDFSPQVRDFYNHQIHIAEHNKFRKTDDYEQMDPQSQQIIDQHVMMHEQFIQPQQDPQQAVMQTIQSMTPEEQQQLASLPDDQKIAFVQSKLGGQQNAKSNVQPNANPMG